MFIFDIVLNVILGFMPAWGWMCLTAIVFALCAYALYPKHLWIGCTCTSVGFAALGLFIWHMSD